MFIRARNHHYGFDFCPGFWDWLKQANAAGVVHSVEAVYNELNDSDDDLSDWAKAHKGFFLTPTQEELSAVTALNQWASNSSDYEQAAKAKFAKDADSFLIGHALAGDHTVVTHEQSRNSKQSIKIPDAAANGVKHVDPFQMLRAEGVRFTLGQ